MPRYHPLHRLRSASMRYILVIDCPHRGRRRPRLLGNRGLLFAPVAFPSLIHNAPAPTNVFLDCAPLYLDDELRKTMGNLIPFKILTAHDGAEGGIAQLRNPRQDIYKEICPADPKSSRPPYAKSGKVVIVRCMLRFGLNRPLTFDNFGDPNRGSISRSPPAIATAAMFFHSAEFAKFPVD